MRVQSALATLLETEWTLDRSLLVWPITQQISTKQLARAMEIEAGALEQMSVVARSTLVHSGTRGKPVLPEVQARRDALATLKTLCPAICDVDCASSTCGGLHLFNGQNNALFDQSHSERASLAHSCSRKIAHLLRVPQLPWMCQPVRMPAFYCR